MTTITETLPALEITRTFDVEPGRVFDAWLSEAWGAWAGPGPVRGDVVQMEAKVGGRYRVAMHLPDGKTLVVGGVYREIVRPVKLVFTSKTLKRSSRSYFVPSAAKPRCSCVTKDSVPKNVARVTQADGPAHSTNSLHFWRRPERLTRA